MRTRHVLVVTALIIGCLLASIVALAFFQSQPSVINRAHYERLAPGMSQLEVERILGAPRNECHADADVWLPRNGKLVSANLAQDEPLTPVFADAGADDRELVWIGPAGLIAVRLGADGRVRGTHFSPVQLLERPTIANSLARWLK